MDAPSNRSTVLIVEDDRGVQEVLKDQLGTLGCRVLTASSAESALDLLDGMEPDLVLTDVNMGEMTGIEFCAHLKGEPRFQLTPVVLLTALSDVDSRVAGLAAGADDFFSKPVDFVELRTRVTALLRTKSALDQLEHSDAVISTLGLTIEARDPYTHGHCERLARLAVALGRGLGVEATTLRALALGGFLHDVGKVAVPDAILLKSGPLAPGERMEIERHPNRGADMLAGLRTLDQVRPIIRHHHERWDGSGYPGRLTGEAIPLTARIMAVVDVYDALRTERPYKPDLSHAETIGMLCRETDAGSWDPHVTATFIGLFDRSGMLMEE
jgi:putative two-component system response regulator